MKDFFVVARPSPIDLMRNKFPHNNPSARVTVTSSLEEAISASQLDAPEQSKFEDALSHLQMPQIMVIYHTQGELQPPVLTATPGKPQQATGSVFDAMCIKTIDVMISDDLLHLAEARKDENVGDVMEEVNSLLWNRVRYLEKYVQALNIYTKTPPDAWKVWFQNIATAEKGCDWHIPDAAASYFKMYYELSPFRNDVERSAQFATAKTAHHISNTTVLNKSQSMVLKALENTAMRATRHVSALYGYQAPPRDYERLILQYTMPLLAKINSMDREAFVKGVQTTGELWAGVSAEEILKEAYRGFKQNHPAYKNSLDETLHNVIDTMHSPVPMMVYGYWEGAMQQRYQCRINDDTQKAFQESFSKSDGYSEMRKIGEAIDAAQSALFQQNHVVRDMPSGMEVAQEFTNAHLTTGMYTPVCFAWVPDDIRQYAEATFIEHAAYRESSMAMTYALAASMVQCNRMHNSAAMMRDISTVMNEVTIQMVRSGVDAHEVSDLINEAFKHTSTDDIVNEENEISDDQLS